MLLNGTSCHGTMSHLLDAACMHSMWLFPSLFSAGSSPMLSDIRYRVTAVSLPNGFVQGIH